MLKYFIYYRKSTDEIDRQVLSLDAQERAITELVRKERLSVAGEFEESRSAKSPGRREFNEMLARIEAGDANGILAWDVDRLYRNPVDEGRVRWLLQQGVIKSIRTPVRAYTPADAGLLMAVEGGRASDFIIHHRRDVMRGVREKLLSGGWPGQRPLGYVYDHAHRNIVPDPEKAHIVSTVFEEFAQGDRSLLSTSDRLASFGVLTPSGKQWTKSKVHDLLTNRLYMGVMVWNGETFEGKFKPLVTPELFAKVQAVLKVRSRPRKGRKGHNFPFCGVFSCSCGAMMTAQFARGRHGGLYRYYRCTRKVRACAEPYVQEGAVIEQASTLLSPLAISAREAETIYRLLDQQAKSTGKAHEDTLAALTARIKVVQDKLNRLVQAHLADVIDEESYREASLSLVTEKAALKTERARLSRTRTNSWIEPSRAVVNALELAGKIQETKRPEDIVSLIRKIGTNPRIAGKKVSFDFSEPFRFPSEILAKNRSSVTTGREAADNLLDSRLIWCALRDSNPRPYRCKRSALTN